MATWLVIRFYLTFITPYVVLLHSREIFSWIHCSSFTGDQTCWNGWDAKGDSCYKLYNEKRTWAGAQAECNAERGSLAKLNSQDKNYFVFLHLIKPANPSSSVWIGLSRDSDNKFYWSDGAPAKYTNWNPGSPDTSPGNNKNCTKISPFSGLWEDEEFDFTHPFVCGRGERIEDLIIISIALETERRFLYKGSGNFKFLKATSSTFSNQGQGLSKAITARLTPRRNEKKLNVAMT